MFSFPTTWPSKGNETKTITTGSDKRDVRFRRQLRIQLFWFAGVFRRVGSRVVCSMQGIKRHDIHARRREHSEVDIVRHDELVVFG
jgi:hypothetical protein